MNDLRQVAQAALEAMSMAQAYGSYDQGSSVPRHLSIASRDLRAALAQPEPTPVCTYRCEAWPECGCASIAQPERQAEFVECGANGSGPCSIKPCGPRGALQCEWCGAAPPQHAAPAVFLPDRAELSDAWAALLDAGESPICEDDTVANAIRRLTGRSLTLTVSTDDTFHGNYRITDGGRSRGVTIARSDLADDMSEQDLRELYAGACETAAHSSVLLEPLGVDAFLKWARS